MRGNRIGLVACALLAAACSGPLTGRAGQVGPVFRSIESSVVVVLTKQSEVVGDTATNAGTVATVGGLGSGVLISSEGEILTAAHVVQTADEVEIVFPSGAKLPGRVLGSEPFSDVALVKVTGNLPQDVRPVALGDSNASRVGDPVFVVGAPLGITHTLTVGHLSARRKLKLYENAFQPTEFIQTDAAINQGNSGGPMFNMKGEVIGIVSHIVSQSGGSQGLGFAVTSNEARRLLMDGLDTYTGSKSIPMTGALAQILNVPPECEGVLVQAVAKGSLAERMGLKPGQVKAEVLGREVLLGGDVLFEVNGLSLKGESAARAAMRLRAMPVGGEILLKVLREGDIVELKGHKL